MESVLTWRPLGSLLNKVSFRELSFSPIDSIVSFNFDCLLACWWTHFCIDPRNFVIDSSVFEPIGFAAELFVEMSLSRLGLSESLTCAWLLIQFVSVTVEAPFWFVVALLPGVFVLVCEAGRFRSRDSRDCKFSFYATGQVMSGVVSSVMEETWINWISLLKILV